MYGTAALPEPQGRRLTRDEARRIAAKIAKPSELVKRPQY
jgi:hypothetical protein